MAWTTPRTWATSELVTALTTNSQLRDDAAYLYSAIAAPAALSFSDTGTLNDWSPGTLTLVNRLVYTGGGVTINGLVAVTTYRVIALVNTTANTLSVAHEQGGSAAANRILTPTAATVVVGYFAILLYDVAAQRWRIFG